MTCDRCKSSAVALFGGHPAQQGAAWCLACCERADIARCFDRLINYQAANSSNPIREAWEAQRKTEKMERFREFLNRKQEAGK